jgi:PAS domain S-box-containing protein
MSSNNYSFSKLIDGERVKNLMESFYKITGIPSTLIDLQGDILTLKDGAWIAAGWQDICTNFHRANENSLKNCIESDVTCSNNLSKGEEYSIYMCKNGLIDVAVPVYIDGNHVANLFTGQFLFEKPDIEFFRKQATKYGFNEEKYLKALSKVPVFSEEYLKEGITFLKDLASFIGETGLKQKKLQERNHELKDSENKFRSFTDGIVNGLVITRFGKIEYVNPGMCTLLKVTESDLMGKNLIDFMTISSREIAKHELYKLEERSADVKNTLELELVNSDGDVIVCELRTNVIELKGKVYGLSIFQDISERKEAERLVEESEIKYHTLFDNAAEGIFLLRKDKIIECNQQSLEIFGATGEDLIGSRPYNWSPERQEDGLKSKKKAMEYINAALEGESQSFEWLHMKMDGSKIFTIISLNRLKVGEEYILQAIIRDITPRKINELKLKKLTSDLKIRFKILKTMNELSEFVSSTELPLDQVFNKIVNKLVNCLQYPQHASARIKIFGEVFLSKNFQKSNWELKSPIRVNAENMGSLKIFYPDKLPFKGEDPFLKEERYLINNLALKLGDFLENRQIKDELIHERDKLKSILDSMEDGVYICNPDYHLEYANPIILKQFGPINGKKCYEYLHNRTSVCPWCVNDEVFQGKIVKWECYSQTGQTFDVLDTPLKNPDGSISKLEFSHDITLLKEYQKKLSHQKDILQTILDNAPIMIAYLDEDGNLTYFNKRFEEILGWSMQEIPQFNILKKMYPDHEYREYVIDFIKKSEGKWGYFKTKNRDGEIIDTSWSNVELIDGTNIGIGQDITERKKIESALRESEEKYRLIVENAQEGIWTIDSKGYTNFVNPTMADMLGYSVDEMIGKHLFSFMDDKNVELVKKEMDRIKSRVIKGQDFEFRCKNGGVIYTSLATTPLYNNNEYTGTLALVSDITHRKIADDEIKKSLKEKDVLLSEIHHRVKNNMQIISSLLNLQAIKIHDKEVIRFFRDTQTRVRAMAMIHEKLYESSDFAHISFSSYVNRLISQLFDSYAQDPSKIKLNLDIKDVNFNIETAIPLGLIINELVSNILKHAFPKESKGHVTIKLENFNGQNLLTVEDDGVGIPPEIDFKNSTTLGLELVNTLVEQIDGQIELDKSSGSKFTIEFNEIEYEERIS